MNSRRQDRAKELFDAARSLKGDERRALVDDACEDDDELRRDAEILLRQYDELRDTEERDSFDDSETESLTEQMTQPAVTVAGHRIHQRIGEGGMGEVYKAEQLGAIRRTVALKIIRHGMETKEVVARFESERQALALMDHPNVARVFGAGATEQGRPYFSMEYVKGVPVTKYCDRHRLSADDRLELFIQVCDGVRHAHQKGIIHRDLKPSNVLVTIQDEKAAPKIIDFGVAKAIQQRLTERTFFTEVGQLIGTPEYMSPEQAEMTQQDIDTRTDVYSLGVILYELLAGALPFDPKDLRRAGYAQMQRVIREVEPSRPSTRVSTAGDQSEEAAQNRRTDPRSLFRKLRGDLDWITMKALEKDRTRRYGSPSEMAADITRYLQHQPVEAGPPNVVYRFKKFARRHRVGLGAASLVAVAVIGALLVSLGALARARREASTSNRVLQFLSGVFVASDPYVAKGEDISARELLDRALESIDDELGDQPQVRVRLKDLMGGVYMSLGEYDRSEALLAEALTTRRRLYGQDHLDVAASLSSLARLRWNQGRYEESKSLALQALEIRRSALGDNHPDIAESLYQLAFAETEIDPLQSAQNHLEEALQIRERALGPAHTEVGETLSQLGWVIHLTGQDGGQAHLERARAIMEHEYGEVSAQVGQCLHRLALILTKKGDYQRARELHERTLAINETVYGPDHPAVANSLNNLGAFAWYVGDFAAAGEHWGRALEIRENALGPDHPLLTQSLMNLALVVQNGGEYTRARTLMERALSIDIETYGENHARIANARQNLGIVLLSMGLEAEAEGELRESLRVYKKLYGPSSEQVGLALAYLGEFELKTGNFEAAEDMYRRSLPILEETWGEDNPNLHPYLLGLADTHRYQQQRDEAEELYRKALEIAEEAHGPNHLYVCHAVMGLANVYAGRDEPAKASAFHSRAVSILKSLGEDDDDEWYDDFWQAEYWTLIGETERAVAYVRTALERGCPKSRIIRDPELSLLHGNPEFEAIMSAF